MTPQLYVASTNLEVPGIEAIFEYGDASQVLSDRIPGAMLINDQSQLERVQVRQIDGLHDDPEMSEGRQPSADRHGERAGRAFYRGRTIGLTGRAQAGSIGAMRNVWRRLRGQFGTVERDLLVHHPYEVPALVNRTVNPLLEVDGYGWFANATAAGGTITGPTGGVAAGNRLVGQVSITAIGACTLYAYNLPLDLTTGDPLSRWDGQDLWLTARVRGSGSTFSSLAVGFNQHQVENGIWSLTNPLTAVSQASPASGTWYQLSARVPSTSVLLTILQKTTHVSASVMLVTPGAGSYTLSFTDVGMVFLEKDDPTPTTFFAGNTPGFDWDGLPNKSTSSGPHYAQNRIIDPRFELSDTASNWSYYSTGLTVNQVPKPGKSWVGDHVDASLYYKATHDGTSTSRAMGVIAIDLVQTNTKFRVVPGRIYRWSVQTNVLNKPPGNLTAKILWYDIINGIISTANSDVMATGVNIVSVTSTAPANALGAWVSVSNDAVTTASSVLEFYLSDPCFVDITNWDPGSFYGTGDLSEEVDRYRRIPRPFLLKDVRKTGDMKAPEQQNHNTAWRDFTMSLRASDPRIYCLDERQRWSQLTGNPHLVSVDMAPLVTPPLIMFGQALTTPPTGFTAEGQSGTSLHFGTQSLFSAMPMMSIGNSVDASSPPSPPANIYRVYRSAEGYTYQVPRVIAHGHVIMKNPSGFPAGFQAYWNGTSWEYNSVGVIAKRVSSSQWIEFRVNSTHNYLLQSLYGNSTGPFTFEIWSSHDATGAAGVTRLAMWDFDVGGPVSDPEHYPIEIEVEIDSANRLNMLVTSTVITSSGPLRATTFENSYELSPSLISLFGATVAGRVGQRVRSEVWTNTANYLTFGFPWISYFEAEDSDVDPTVIVCPVIGDVDTPPKIQLRGDVDGPIVSITRPDGFIDSMRLNGVTEEANPVTIDTGAGTIVDAAGVNRYSMLSSGSLSQFQPGLNRVSITGRGWGTFPTHVGITWRDALS